MDTLIKKLVELDRNLKADKPVRLYNPLGLEHHDKLNIKCIEFTDEYTRIDFIYRSSTHYINGGWIMMEPDAYIQPTGSKVKYRLVRAIGIPLAPIKHCFKRQGEYHTYSLIFPALPKNTQKIDIIEKIAPGNYFNFYNVDYSNWMNVIHPLDIYSSKN